MDCYGKSKGWNVLTKNKNILDATNIRSARAYSPRRKDARRSREYQEKISMTLKEIRSIECRGLEVNYSAYYRTSTAATAKPPQTGDDPLFGSLDDFDHEGKNVRKSYKRCEIGTPKSPTWKGVAFYSPVDKLGQ
ncbi:hypothetical protein CEXT_161541 [Caerostris extrusa]|uniref:Uncharacterized protein n=1 Tax=Caerostris extrusa TaxID=172846 RepID=A0AAV4XMG5_CAEEX|nr:hypothetical protein CEXT_161541 [Caerostris extrusa]